MNLIIVHAHEINKEHRVILSDDRARHMRKVLRVTVGKTVRLGLLNGPFGEGTVIAVDGQLVELVCSFEKTIPPKPRLDLILAMPRPKVLNRLWAQLATLGVGQVILLRSEKVERYYFDSHVIEESNYTARLIEGLQQARCTHLPTVSIQPLFKPFVEDKMESLFKDHQKVLADPTGVERVGSLCNRLTKEKRVVLAIGAEGGWTPYELGAFDAHGFETFALGDRILRSDTACVSLVARLAEVFS